VGLPNGLSAAELGSEEGGLSAALTLRDPPGSFRREGLGWGGELLSTSLASLLLGGGEGGCNGNEAQMP
jgi:hypothetical protein